jgi:MoaA/NifB/PqqE/SkfB family radical SAM enzyme
MERERVFWKLFGRKLISFRKLDDGRYVGSGLLNPLFERLSLFTMLALQARFYAKYKSLPQWKGMRVANPFAPPVGSRPQIRALRGLVKKYLSGRPSPLAMTFAVTYRCQCSCVHCSAGRSQRGDIPELSTEEAKRLIDESQKLGVCILAFTGGEPLLRTDIFELIAHVDQRKCLPLIFTNGLLLSPETVDRLAQAGLYTLFVSLDAPKAEEHDRLRATPGLFETAVGGLRRAKEKGIMVGISSYASRTGTEAGQYWKMYDLAAELDAHTLLLFDSVPTGRQIKQTSEMLTEEQREEILEFTRGIFRRCAVPSLSSQAWQNSLEGYLSGIGCLAGNIQYYVSAYGDVAPCDFTPLSFGNIREEPLRDIWNRLVSHPAYNHTSHICRMQHAGFRRCYVDPIPDGARLPYPIAELPRVDYLENQVGEQILAATSKAFT